LRQLAGQSVGLDSTTRAGGESHLTATVVVCTRYRPALLRKCLEGISALERAPDEVIVVDNTSGDRETAAVAREFGAIYTVEPVQGLSRARNKGMFESHSEIVAYLDDDATPEAHWLGYILEPFKDPGVSAVTGRIVTPQTSVNSNADLQSRSLCNKDPEWFGVATFGGLGLGSNMAFRKRACAGQRIFDERLGRGAPFEIAEENFAFALLLSRGDTAVHLPHAIVFHPSPVDGGCLSPQASARRCCFSGPENQGKRWGIPQAPNRSYVASSRPDFPGSITKKNLLSNFSVRTVP